MEETLVTLSVRDAIDCGIWENVCKLKNWEIDQYSLDHVITMTERDCMEYEWLLVMEVEEGMEEEDEPEYIYLEDDEDDDLFPKD